MYLALLKTAVTKALQSTFDGLYPNPDFRDTWVSIEYPNDVQAYPGIWIGYTDSGALEIAGINHREIVVGLDGGHEVTRWKFQGSLSLTVAAFSSLERDNLYDELVRVIAFAQVENTPIARFRTIMENNPYLGINLNYDVLHPSGDAASPGTPWGGNEIIYERTLSLDVIGEFVSDPTTNEIVPLSEVQVQGYVEGTVPPAFPDVPTTDPHKPWTPYDWS
jgi:hypothetical protein